MPEHAETFLVKLSTLQGATLGDATGVISILRSPPRIITAGESRSETTESPTGSWRVRNCLRPVGPVALSP